MDQTEQLNQLKVGLQKRISENLELALEGLFSIIADNSSLKNELIHLEGQFNQLESETRKGIIDYNFRVLQLNRIREGALQLVEQIEIKDLSEIALLPTEPSLSSEPLIRNLSPKIEKEPAQTPAQISLADFELFVEENRALLTAFPKVYRKAKSIIYKNDRLGNEHQTAYQTIQVALPFLSKYEELLSPIRNNIHQIRLNPDHRKYWIRYTQVKEIPFDAELEDLAEVRNSLPDVEQLHQELSVLKLL